MGITKLSKVGFTSASYQKYDDFLAGNTAFSPSSYESIASATGNGSSTSFTFSSIPNTYASLQLRGILRDNAGGSASSAVGFQFNASGSSTGTSHWMLGIADSPAYTNVGSDTSETFVNYLSVGSAALSNVYSAFIVDIHDYASTTKNKTIRTFMGVNGNNNANTTQVVGMFSNLWIDTSAINEIKLVNRNGNAFSSLSNVALYGIKGA